MDDRHFPSMPLSPDLRSLANLVGPTRDAAERLEREWAPDSPPEVVAAATFGAAFGSAVENLRGTDIETIGKHVEMLLTSGDEHTRTAIATGFLESLLAQASAGTFSFERIAWSLGPESLKYCREWDKFTGNRTHGLW